MGNLINFCAGADNKTLPADKVQALLINVLDHGSNAQKIQRARDMRRLARPQYLMLDSSGYQLHEGEKKGKRMAFDPNLPMKHTAREINLAPKHGMEVASTLQVDIAVGQDFPIRKFRSSAEREAEFQKKLPYNVRWAYESAAAWKECCPKAQFFLPIQCYDIKQLDRFMEMIDGIGYDGVSMPIRNIKIPDIALFLVDFYQRGIKKVHLLGTSSFLKIALCAYMSHHLFEWVSLDATTWRKASEVGGAYNPWNLSRIDLRPCVNIKPGTANSCPCPYCAGMEYQVIQGLPKKEKIRLLRQHNWWVLEKAFHDLFEHGAGVIQLERFLKTRSNKVAEIDQLIKTLSLIDALKDVDISSLIDVLSLKPPKRKPSHTCRPQTIPNKILSEASQNNLGSESVPA